LSSQADDVSKDSRDGLKRAVSHDLLVKPENYFVLYQAEMLQNMMLQQKIDELLAQINTNRIFMNMVIHDMRNPTGAIEFGVRQSIDNLH